MRLPAACLESVRQSFTKENLGDGRRDAPFPNLTTLRAHKSPPLLPVPRRRRARPSGSRGSPPEAGTGGAAAESNGNAAGFSAFEGLTPLPDAFPASHPSGAPSRGAGNRHGPGAEQRGGASAVTGGAVAGETRRSLRRSGCPCSRRPTAAGQAARVSEEKRDEVDAALREAQLAATEASRAEYREATRRLARSNVELPWRQQDAGREAAAAAAAAAMALITKQGQEKAEEIEKLKQELIDLKQQAQEEMKKLADYYAQQIKELEEKFQKKVREIGQIQLEQKLIKEFCRGKASMEKELEDFKDSMEISNRRYQEVVVRLERRFLEEKKRLEEDVEKKQIMMAETAQCEAVLQLNSTGREVFKENVCLHGAFAYQLKETMELQKIKQKLEEDKTVLLQEKETNEGLIRKKILQISRQKAQIGDLQHKVAKLEMALCCMTRQSERETQKTQHQALRENQASMVEIKKLQQLLEMKDREMNRVKKLARNILNERTEVERFFLDALEHVKQEIVSSRKHYKKKAQTAYYRKMMEACAGKEEFPKIKTFKSNINSTNSVYRDLEEAEKCYWEKIQFEKVDISELTWEQKERVLRLLFAKMNGTNPRKYNRVLAISASAPDNTKEESKIGTENASPNLIFITQQANLSDSSSAVILPHIQMLTPQTE
ncbi:basal body-orientation factor 1 [Harpia harpyja]|uniref:basal body-orientation factor 1 n=1 Tax=Harpia harpyja TaxID=202280 RepID=UPI0022B0E1FB|nr:basal body-orientation factor 1 [Harpia harpyja]